MTRDRAFGLTTMTVGPDASARVAFLELPAPTRVSVMVGRWTPIVRYFHNAAACNSSDSERGTSVTSEAPALATAIFRSNSTTETGPGKALAAVPVTRAK